MKALILNSGMGKRMGLLTDEYPKCMIEITSKETILSRQLRLLCQHGITDVIITTGHVAETLRKYCKSLNLPLRYTFVYNPVYALTNNIYSVYLAREHLMDDVVLMHGDLVFERSVLSDILRCKYSCMAVSSRNLLPQKDFKAVINNGLIKTVGVDVFQCAVAAQPFYKLLKGDWALWLQSIIQFCDDGRVSGYAEDAFNEVSGKCRIYPMDFGDSLCAEIDTPEDLTYIKQRLDAIATNEGSMRCD